MTKVKFIKQNVYFYNLKEIDRSVDDRNFAL